MKVDNKKLLIGFLIGAVIASGAFFAVDQLGEEPSQREETQTCENLPQLPNNATRRVTKVLDGDTFLIEGGHSVRLLGVDADETGYPCYDEAKEKLEELALNKEVTLQKGATNCDQYGRYLRYPFIDDKNISLELVKQGLAIARFSAGQTKYKDKITEAEQKSQESKRGCKWGTSTKQEEDSQTTSNLSWEELTGGNIVGACQAGNHQRETAIVQGRVVDSYHASESNTVFLNFAKPYPNHCFVAVIFSSDLYKFVENPEDFYENKTVRVKGKVKMYEGKPEIILESPNQIEVGNKK